MTTGRILTALLLGLLAAGLVLAPPALAHAAPRHGAGNAPPDHFVIVAIPGVTWPDLRDTPLPALRASMPVVADLSARTASRTPDIVRSYLTLGAGNPAYAPTGDPEAALAFRRDAPFEAETAADAVARRTGTPPRGELVATDIAVLRDLQRSRLYGAQVGALGDALERAGLRRAVVSAADLALHPRRDQMRRAAVLALMDSGGGVDAGTLDGLLRRDPSAPFGVSTDPSSFLAATRDALRRARVVLLDFGETTRANEYAGLVAGSRVARLERDALRRTDVLLGRVLRLLGPRDALVVLAPSGPTPPVFREHLAPIGASGWSFGRRPAWLTSATTRHDGMVVLSDVAPTVLDAFGLNRPDSMVGTPMYTGRLRRGGMEWLVELDRASGVRERFAAIGFWLIAVILSLLAVLAFVAFLGPRLRWLSPLVGTAYLCLGVFPAAHVIRALGYWRWGVGGALVVLYAMAGLFGVLAWRFVATRWGGAIALMMASAVLFGTDVAAGGPLQVNGMFGHSPLVAGRFYGVSNPGYAILYSGALLGLTGLAELRGHARLPWWAVICLFALVPLDGLPQMGADLGGILAGVPAVVVTVALGRRWRVRARTLLGAAAAAVAATLAAGFLDLARPPRDRTHLGRFLALVLSKDTHAVAMTLHRKAAASITSLTVTRWTYFIPVSFAVLALLLIRPQGILRQVLPHRPLVRAGLWGTLVAGGLGFAANDSGISIPAVALAFVIPFLVLMAVDSVHPRGQGPP